MKKTYNVTDIMTRAWAIRREAAETMGCRASEVLMSECLRMAWAEAEGAYAAGNAAAVINAWAAMSPEAQYSTVRRVIRRAARDMIGRSTEGRYLQAAELPAYSLYRAHELICARKI